MKEAQIRKIAIDLLKKEGWISWFAPKVRFHKTDIFGIIDIFALKNNKKKFIQLTTLTNLAARRKKILNFFKKNKVNLSVEIWAWNGKNKKFEKKNIF